MKLLSLGLEVPEKRTSPLRADWLHLLGAPSSTSGEFVDSHTAMQVSTVFACTTKISQCLANLSLKTYRLTDGGREEATDESLYRLLRYEPNPDMSAHSFWETVVLDLCLNGNSFVEIGRLSDSSVAALWLIPSRACQPFRLPTGELRYRVISEQGGTRELLPSNVLHFRLASRDGIWGMSPIEQNREAIGLSMAATRYGSRLFRNNSVPPLAVMTDQTFRPEDKTKFRQDWEALHGGSNQGRIAVLDNGLRIEKLALSPTDTQWLALRQYSANELCSLFGVPSHIINNDTANLSDNSGQTLTLNFIRFCLVGYARRIEAELERKLLPNPIRGASTYQIEHDFSSLLRGDIASTMQSLAVGRQWSLLTANEGRNMLGMNSKGAAGDVLMSPSNMINAERLLDSSYAGFSSHPTNQVGAP